MAKFKEVLKNRNFFFLWAGQIVSQFGDRLNQMALIALIYARAPGSTFQLAKVLSFTIIPVFLVGPFAASYVDRWDRRRTMISCDLLRAALVALIVLFLLKLESIWPIYMIIFLVFSVSRFFVPAKMAIIPELVSQKNLLLANSLSSTTGMIAAVAGFGLGGLIVERVGSGGGFLIDSFTYLVSGLFILMIARGAASHFKKIASSDNSNVRDSSLLQNRPSSSRSGGRFSVVRKVFYTFLYHKKEASAAKALGAQRLLKKTLLADIKEGWQYLARDKDARFVAQMFFLLWSALGAVYVVIIVFVQRTLGSITQDLGLLAMFLGIGLLAGSLIYGRFGEKIPKIRIIFISLAVSGITLSLFAVFLKVFASILFASGLSFILGLTVSPIIISSQTLIHEVIDTNLRGRVFGSLEIVAHLAFLLFMLISAFLADKVGRFWILLFVGVVLTVVGLGAIILKPNKNKKGA